MMNEDLSSIIEHALMYASPLPVTTAEHVPLYDDCHIDAVPLASHEPVVSPTVTLANLSHAVNLREINPVEYDTCLETAPTEDNSNKDNSKDNVTDSIIEQMLQDSEHNLRVKFGFKVHNANIHVNTANSLQFVSTTDRKSLSPNMVESISVSSPQVEHTTYITLLPHSTSSHTATSTQDENRTKESSNQQHVSTTMETKSKSTTSKTKKKRNREKNPNPPPEPFLPPCSICNVKSSGFHYGANTCEPCKAFFRRTLKSQKLRFKCKCKPEGREEWKRGPIKNGCSACRYQRCLMVGMSKDAIKIGRYTLNHKTKNIKQIKHVEATDHTQDTVNFRVPEEGSSSTTSGLDSGFGSPGDISSSPVVQGPEASTSSSPASSSTSSIVCRSQIPSTAVISPQEIDYIVKTLTEVHTRVPFDETIRLPIEVIKQKQTEYLEKYKLKTELFGDMGLSKEEFLEFYNITGIDLDGRLQHMEGAFQFFEQKISLAVAFSKAIPEFKNLKIDDQANLVKGSRAENLLLHGYKMMLRNFDIERRMITTPWGVEVHMDELARQIPIDTVLHKFKLAQQMQKLQLTIEEEAVLRAIVTMFADRCVLEDRERVEQIQEKLVVCLQHLLTTRPGGPDKLLYKIFSLMTDLRNFTENENEFTKKMLVDWPMLSKNKYQLLKEFLT